MDLTLGSNLRREVVEGVRGVLPSSWILFARDARRRGVTTLSSLDEVDAQLARAEHAFQASEDEGRRVLASFELAPPSDLPADPWSDAYREAQLRMYERVSGRNAYTSANEQSAFDLEHAKRVPYPYSTRSAGIVGDELIAQGFLIKSLGVAPPAKVLEFGPGWGNTTTVLAAMDFRVTAVEIESRFCDLLAHRCRDHLDNVTIVNADMLEFDTTERYDAVVFYESFHHCSDHVLMLRRLHNLLTPGGRVVFGREPVGVFPFPWGLRLDGLSLWSTRKYGWLELGFETSYFLRTLKHTGWKATRYRSRAICPDADVFVALPSRV